MMIDLRPLPIGAQLLTRNGRAARLICKDAASDQPFVVLVSSYSGETVETYSWDGAYFRGAGGQVPCVTDLVAVATDEPAPTRIASAVGTHAGAQGGGS
jgi:hypothetical protein